MSQRRTTPREVRRVSDAQDLQGVTDSAVENSAPTGPQAEPDLDVVKVEETPGVEETPEVASPPPAPEELAPTEPEPTLPDLEVTVAAPEASTVDPSEEVQPSDAPVVGSEVEYTITVLETQLELEFVFPCGEGEFILDAAERAGFAMPSSCRSGGCLVCAGRVENGTYEMGEQYVLEDDQIERGFMLLCCSVPTSDGRYKSHQEDELD